MENKFISASKLRRAIRKHVGLAALECERGYNAKFGVKHELQVVGFFDMIDVDDMAAFDTQIDRGQFQIHMDDYLHPIPMTISSINLEPSDRVEYIWVIIDMRKGVDNMTMAIKRGTYVSIVYLECAVLLRCTYTGDDWHGGRGYYVHIDDRPKLDHLVEIMIKGMQYFLSDSSWVPEDHKSQNS